MSVNAMGYVLNVPSPWDDVIKALCNVCRTRSYCQYLTQEYHYRCEHFGVSFVSHEADAKSF